MRVGFIGLGSLGKTIARRLLDQGVPLIVWNRTREKAADLGVPVAESPADLIKQVDVVLMIVFDSAASEEVILGKGGLIEGGVKGKVVVDMTTNHFAFPPLAYREIKGRGGFYLDAPVLGSVVPAQRGELVMLVGGDEEKLREVRPILERFCRKIYYVGEAGKATQLKLINNIVLGGIMEVLAEAIAIAEKAGFDRQLVIDVLNDGAGKSYILDVKREKLLREDFSTHFSVDLIHKDLHYAQDLIKELGVFSFSVQNIKEAYGFAKAMGMGKEDFSAVLGALLSAYFYKGGKV
ncbi:6-phosphogluconate dehydrogenase NAD-binding protein [Thermocrinis albus DSM 14484]|uniref:6-phosphogluconate dehydrogenase NAD-binding protein n=1 Tax=Thermocrinis albus (strain DSM 14484 / JCM 11386 / HI 11/12) TaxID=638303 RepID=D3SLT6_THEAH|nr:NAD(P)-dependent oxidoreductase [Thermocrinis albus]ADC89716.1 6-phosphogluconate dehydrogenase NAD-binding protein [Thermocrinis albus DSM 14484]